jgi:hypothetical protein
LYKVTVVKPEGKRRLGRPRRKWEDGIRMDVGEIGLGLWIGFDWLWKIFVKSKGGGYYWFRIVSSHA